MSKRRILIVEDEAIILMVLSEVLIDNGFDVTSARNGVEASRLLEAGPFDLLMTDIRLPGAMTGVDLARLARQHQASIPIIIASGYAEAARQELEGLDPAAIFLSKPYNLDAVAKLMASLTAAGKDSL